VRGDALCGFGTVVFFDELIGNKICGMLQ
jgi:hypothetical protein